MAQYNVKDPEDLIPCPYDDTHMIRAKRMPYHLLKCRQNYRGSVYVKCPFNACHEFPKPELQYHRSTCADRVHIEKDIIFATSKNKGPGTYFRGCTEVPEVADQCSLASKECWDKEVSPFPVQVVDKAVFTGRQSLDKKKTFTPSEKLAFFEKLKDRIPIDDSIKLKEPDNSDNLRLPHNPALVLDSTSLRAENSSSFTFQENLALLQRLARGRGGSIPSCTESCASDDEPQVGVRA